MPDSKDNKARGGSSGKGSSRGSRPGKDARRSTGSSQGARSGTRHFQDKRSGKPASSNPAKRFGKPAGKRGSSRSFAQATTAHVDSEKKPYEASGEKVIEAGKGGERGPWRPNAQNAELALGVEQQENVYRGELELDEEGNFKYRSKPRAKSRYEGKGAKRAISPGAVSTSGVARRDGAKTASPARLAALEVTTIVRERDAFAQDLIRKHIDSSRMSREDRAFATRLVLGVVSSSGTLDDIINRSAQHGAADIPEAVVRDALRISTYELVFLKKEPHAVVSQGVELVRSVSPKAAGLANAVLRRVCQKARLFPFGDPRTDIKAFSTLHAFPEWIVRRAIIDLGPEAASRYIAASNEPAPLYIGVNSVKAADQDVLEVLTEAHGDPERFSFEGSSLAGCYKLSEGRVLFDGRVHRMISQGKLLVADASSQAVALFALPDEKPRSFLEIGAGRGTKTILIQSNAQRLYGGQIPDYVTLDNVNFKTELTAKRAEDYGVQLSESLTGDACDLEAVVGERLFDAVFVDAPCSGLGTLRRHPEIRWRLQEGKIAEFAKRDALMLSQAAAHVAPGGTLTYATCTVAKAENEDVVSAFLDSAEGACFARVDFTGRESFKPLLVVGGPDAHFAVKLQRKVQA